MCDRGFIWNPSNCECEYDKLCDVAEYLDYENCKCRKKLVDKLVEECTENVEEVKLAKTSLIEPRISVNVLAHCTLCYFLTIFTNNVTNQQPFVLFTTNTWILFKRLMLKKVLFMKQHLIIKHTKWLRMLKA